MLNQIKVGIIVGVVVLIATLIGNWLVQMGKDNKEERTIRILTDSVYTYKKQLNDSVSVFVTQTRQYSETIERAKQENRVLRSTIMNDQRKSNITRTSETKAIYVDDMQLKMYKDSFGIYRGAYEDVYRALVMNYNPETEIMSVESDSIIVPISRADYDAKVDYKKYNGIKRVWKRIFESKKSYIRIWSDNPKVKIISNDDRIIVK